MAVIIKANPIQIALSIWLSKNEGWDWERTKKKLNF